MQAGNGALPRRRRSRLTIATTLLIVRHNNGWVTHADERPDGTWAAWAAREGSSAPEPDYLEMDDVNAKRAADFALRRKSGHHGCSDRCTGWELQAHGVSDGEGDPNPG